MEFMWMIFVTNQCLTQNLLNIVQRSPLYLRIDLADIRASDT